MTLETLNFTVYVQTALSAIVACFAFIKFELRELYIRLLGLAFLIGFLSNMIALLFVHIGLRPFLNIVASVYDLMIVCVISLIFYYALNKRYGKWFLITSICFLIIATINLIWFQKLSISSYNMLISSFIVISYCIFYFYRLMIELPSTHLQRMPMFWFNSAFLIYSAGALILFLSTSYIVNVLKNNLLTYWVFHNLLNICEHLIVLIGLYFDFKDKNSNILTHSYNERRS